MAPKVPVNLVEPYSVEPPYAAMRFLTYALCHNNSALCPVNEK